MRINYGKNNGTREVVLSFDDGPHPQNTPKLLDLLKKENIKALFFVLGQRLEQKRNMDIVKRAFEEGHIIGNHSYTHPNLRNLSDTEIRNEILKTEVLIKDYLTTPKLFRPPFGATNLRVNKIIHDLGYTNVLWNVDTLDWKNRSIQWVSDALNQVQAREDSLVLMHDIHKTTVDNVSNLISSIKDKDNNYSFISYV